MKNRLGKRYGRLTVVAITNRRTSSSEIIWRCKCDCGSMTEVIGGHLGDGHTTSCGCFAIESMSIRSTTHGESGQHVPEYRAWKRIKNKCTNPKHQDYKNYGGRGIKMCKRWQKSYLAFLKDVGRRPSPELQTERVNNNGDYKPSNVVWGTRIQQARNKRSNVFLTFNGVRKTMAEWSYDTGISYCIFVKRLKQGWNLRKILSAYG